jgi:gamma-glutamyltranspeptidase/glutathione hydrolase
MFTTRPEILGTFGVVTSTHWLASQTGMAMLERGGNAFDACTASAFILQIVEPHLVGPAGEVPAIFYSAKTGKIETLCGQGTAPAGATIAYYKSLGLDLIPGSGSLSTVIPGSFDAWMLLMRDHGSLRLRDILEPAIDCAGKGHPVLPRVADTIASLKDLFTREWPTSGAIYMPGGEAPTPRTLVKNPQLAATWARILSEAEARTDDRDGQFEAARDVFYRGFVAEAMDRFCRTQEVLDSSGRRHRGVLTAEDMASWTATYETPTSRDYHDWTVYKIGPWGQGPVFLQTLAILEGIDIASMDPKGDQFVHTVIEAMKLAFADREAYYGDPDFVTVPMAELLSKEYAASRRQMIGGTASTELRPGLVPGYEAIVRRTVEGVRLAGTTPKIFGTMGEPTLDSMLAATNRRGDTVHIDVVDKFGNMISATPSGGWFQSNPVIPELGFCLNSRLQAFWLEEGLPASLAPGKRPRTTLTPTLATQNGEPRLVFGTPGGDQQEQWQIPMFLRHVHHGMNLQEAIDQPLFYTQHFPSTFFPREARPGHLAAEENFGEDVLKALEERGHKLERAGAWTVGRLTAAGKRKDGMLHAAATPRLMQAYAVGR